jgi:hypothetical protein
MHERPQPAPAAAPAARCRRARAATHCPPAGQVPLLISNVTGWLHENCATPLTPRELYELQDLFSIYVHRSPTAKEALLAPEASIFHGRDIPDRCVASPSAATVPSHTVLLCPSLPRPAILALLWPPELLLLLLTQLQGPAAAVRKG